MKNLNLLILLALLMLSCEKFNQEEPIPAYIKIDSFTLGDTNLIGSQSKRITDAWVTHNGDILGVFQLPAIVPIIPEDSNELFIKAGVMMNGMIETRLAYPFYQPYIQNYNLEANTTTNINPEVIYRTDDQIDIYYFNDFESENINIDVMENSHVEPKFSESEIFEGNGSLHLQLTGHAGDSLAQFVMGEPFAYPPVSAEPAVMLELNYKCDHNFSIGLYLDNGVSQELRRFFTIVSTNGQWKKNYFNLTGTMSPLEYISHRFTIEALLSNTADEANIFIDNIKILSTK